MNEKELLKKITYYKEYLDYQIKYFKELSSRYPDDNVYRHRLKSLELDYSEFIDVFKDIDFNH